MFLNAGYDVIAWNPATMAETALPNLPRAAAVYPASGVSAMLPMTPATNYTASILICGGVEQPNTDAVWSVARRRLALTAQGQRPRQRHGVPELSIVLAHGLPRRCFDVDRRRRSDRGPDHGLGAWFAPVSALTCADDQPSRRHDARAQRLLAGHRRLCVMLPADLADMRRRLVAAVANQPAGYADSQRYRLTCAGYGSNPLLTPLLYDPAKPAGSRWSRTGFQPSTVERMYHSTAMVRRRRVDRADGISYFQTEPS